VNKQWLDGMWDHMREKYGIYLRVLEAIPADRFHAHPIPQMRTPTELVVHTSGSIVRDTARGVASGAIESPEGGEEAAVARLDTKEDVLEFARTCWEQADAAMAGVGDEELGAEVANSWGIPLNGTFAVLIINEEFLHHRGQLYAYARACGAEPPFMWSFEENPEGFRPTSPR